MTDPLADRLEQRPVRRTTRVYQGRVWDVRQDEVDLGAAGVVTRDYLDHTGAVCVLALDESDRVVLIQQYRHPVAAFDWEIPAGLLDVPGEPAWVCAARELHEEVDLTARTWHTLVDYWASPGGMNEALRIYLARDLAPVATEERHTRDGEELGMPTRWVPLDEAYEAVLQGRLHNSALVLAVLTAHAMRSRGWRDLRPVDAPWPEHPAHRG